MTNCLLLAAIAATAAYSSDTGHPAVLLDAREQPVSSVRLHVVEKVKNLSGDSFAEPFAGIGLSDSPGSSTMARIITDRDTGRSKGFGFTVVDTSYGLPFLTYTMKEAWLSRVQYPSFNARGTKKEEVERGQVLATMRSRGITINTTHVEYQTQRQSHDMAKSIIGNIRARVAGEQLPDLDGVGEIEVNYPDTDSDGDTRVKPFTISVLAHNARYFLNWFEKSIGSTESKRDIELIYEYEDGTSARLILLGTDIIGATHVHGDPHVDEKDGSRWDFTFKTDKPLFLGNG